MKIPNTIHYCWFGGNPLPPLAEKCIASWKKYLPNYDIKRWDESNFDVNSIPYTKQAFAAGKYAFVSDYARFWILYNYGGIYFDTDVELINNMDDIIASGPFMGCENEYNPQLISNPTTDLKKYGKELGVAPGLGIGAPKGLPIYLDILNLYNSLQFSNNNMITVVTYVTDLLCKKGLEYTPEIQNISGIKIYPKKYFCPKDYSTGRISISPETVAIHHYGASWHGPKEKLYQLIGKYIGKNNAKFIAEILKRIMK